MALDERRDDQLLFSVDIVGVSRLRRGLRGEHHGGPDRDFVDLVDRQTFEIGPLRITPHLVNHPVEAYGLRVEADGAVLAYTGDTDACPALVELERDADLVLTDSAFVDGRDDEMRGVHLSGSRAAQTAKDAGAKRLMLTHIPTWTPVEDCLRDARTVWEGDVEVAVAGETYEL